MLPIGAYDDLIQDTSTSTWDKQGGIIKNRRKARKTWIFGGAYSKELMVGLAIADVGYIGNAFAYFFIPGEDLYKEQKVIQPFAFGNRFDPGLHDKWSLRNFKIDSQGSNIRLSCTGTFQLEIVMEQNDNGLSFMCPTVDRPFNFTYKNLSLPTSVKVGYQGKQYQMEGRIGGIDFSKGYPPRNTFWNWALISGRTSDGRTVGMNLFRGHNGKYENAAWLDGERILLPNTVFEYDESLPLDGQKWKLRNEDGSIDVVFTPMRARSEKINLKWISHDFTQPFGHFKGMIRHGGETIPFEGYGPVEAHESLW